MEELLLNGHEVSVLDKEPSLEELAFDGRITKKKLQALSRNERDKLKGILESNKELAKLIDEVNQKQGEQKGNSDSRAPSGDNFDGNTIPSFANKGPINFVDNQDEGINMNEVETSLRNKGYTDLYVLFRGLELGYFPKSHDLAFKDPSGKFFGNKFNWVKHKVKYVWEGGPISNGKLNTNLSKTNIQFEEYVKKIALDDVSLSKSQAKKILSSVANIPQADIVNIKMYLQNLEGIENALKNGNVEEFYKFKNEYKKLRNTPFAGNMFGKNEAMLKKQKELLDAEISKNPSNKTKLEAQREKLIIKENKLKELKTKINNPNISGEDLKKLSEEFNIGKLLKVEKNEVKELKELEARIAKLKEDAQSKLKDFNEKAGKDPANISKYKEEGRLLVENTNKEIIELNKKGINNLSKLNIEEVKELSKTSRFVQGLEKTNGGIDKIVGSTGGKVLMSVAILSIAWQSAPGISEMWKQGLSWENVKDVADIAVGFVPILGGVNDLYIWGKGKDWNDRVLSNKEKYIRLGFGIVGLVPGAGLLVKGAGKLANGGKALKIADAGVEAARVTGKIGVYGYLGYEVKESIVELYHATK